MSNDFPFRPTRRDVLAGATATVGFHLLSPRLADAATLPSVKVSIAQGVVAGETSEEVDRFLGIPYAASTAGAGRFMPPGPAPTWTGVRDATRYGPTAPQAADTMPNPPGILAAYAEPPYLKQGEDCLVLNVWTPANRKGLRPVMVWVHDGGFTIGSGSYLMEQGHHLAHRGDVVVVSLNHRLAALGYTDFSRVLGGRYANSDNLGMRDIVAALKWVQQNISAFGGDASSVTLFGCSGGGMKISTLLAMPVAKGLFHRVVMQSGPLLRGLTPEDADEVATKLLTELGIDRAHPEALQQIPFDKITGAEAGVLAKLRRRPIFYPDGFAPVVNGTTLPTHMFDPVASAVSKNIPIMTGQSRSEFTLFTLEDAGGFSLSAEQLNQRVEQMLGVERGRPLLAGYRRTYPKASPSDLWYFILTDYSLTTQVATIADRKANAHGAAVYVYMFEWKTPVEGGRLRAHHGLEIPFVFDTVQEEAAPMTGGGRDAKQMATVVSEAWIAFARTGNPSTPRLPRWPAYDSKTRLAMHFDNTSHVAPFLEADLLDPLRTAFFAAAM